MDKQELRKQLKDHLENLIKMIDTIDLSGYSLLVTYIEPVSGLDVGAFSVYNSLNFVHLLGYTDILTADIRKSLQFKGRFIEDQPSDVNKDILETLNTQDTSNNEYNQSDLLKNEEKNRKLN